MDYEEYKRKALEPIVKYIESVMASYSKEELEARIKKALPEKESEDERIRKWLYDVVDNGDFLAERPCETEKILAYLEKQKDEVQKQFNLGVQAGREEVMYEMEKEQKPTEWSEDYREEDIQTRFAFYTYKDDPSVLYLSNVFVEETSRNHGFGTRILKAAEKVAEAIGAITICLKVKQDSPANAWYRKHGYGYVTFEDGYDWLKKNLEYLKPAKSTEWSEEDEKMLNDTLDSLKRYQLSMPSYPVELQMRWLKSRRPQLKQEEIKDAIQLVYDEELTPYKDGNQWCFLLGDDIQVGICGFGDSILEAALAFYREYTTTKKNICEIPRHNLRHHWKPSEEQMNALKVVARGFPADDPDAIDSLLTDLQKLL